MDGSASTETGEDMQEQNCAEQENEDDDATILLRKDCPMAVDDAA